MGCSHAPNMVNTQGVKKNGHHPPLSHLMRIISILWWDVSNHHMTCIWACVLVRHVGRGERGWGRPRASNPVSPSFTPHELGEEREERTPSRVGCLYSAYVLQLKNSPCFSACILPGPDGTVLGQSEETVVQTYIICCVSQREVGRCAWWLASANMCLRMLRRSLVGANQ